jgi:hypothetical protein
MQRSLSAFGAKRTSRRSNRLLDSQTRFAKRATKATLNTGAPEEIRTPNPQIRSLVLYLGKLLGKLRATVRTQRPVLGDRG